MRRFMLFTGERYYAGGGWLDFAGSFDALDDAVNAGKISVEGRDDFRWWHVVDAERVGVPDRDGEPAEIVAQSDGQAYS